MSNARTFMGCTRLLLSIGLTLGLTLAGQAREQALPAAASFDPGLELRNTGGPDAFGYTFVNSLHAGGPAFEWVEISQVGQAWSMSLDDFEGPLPLGFSFPFYGGSQSQCFVGSNGYLTFGQGHTVWVSTPIPSSSLPNHMIAPFFDDFDLPRGGTVYTWADSENQRFIAQWDGAMSFGSGGPHTFQLRLYATGMVDVAYLDLDESDLSFASVGIENGTGSIGLQYHYQGSGAAMADSVQIRFLPPPSCEPVDCAGQPETEPNEGWNDNNASYEVIRCGESWCGTIQDDGQNADSDWYRYTHFGGDVLFEIEVADFDPELRLVELQPGGDVLAVADAYPRCFGERLSIPALSQGSYFLVVSHAGDEAVPDPQTYLLTLSCSGDPCAGHEALVCEGRPELEPNEGWNDGNASHDELVFGETICGSTWANAGQRDLDWFRVMLDGPSRLRVELLTDAFDAAIYLTDFDPAGQVLQSVDRSPACHPELLESDWLPAGEYFVVVGHNALDGVPEPQAWALTATLEVPAAPLCEALVEAGQLDHAYETTRPAPGTAHWDGSGCAAGAVGLGRDEVHRLVLAQDTDLSIELLAEGEADEVLLLTTLCEEPGAGCLAAVNELGPGPEGERLELSGLPAGEYLIVADFARPGESAAYSLIVRDLNSRVETLRAADFALAGAHPNPFNPGTTIRWRQGALAAARLSVHNLLGEQVDQLELGLRGPGEQQVHWDASRLGSGVYIYTLSSGPHHASGKVLLLK
jgi:hypothetical protein